MRKIVIWDNINETKELRKYRLNRKDLLSEKVEELMYIGRFLVVDINDLNFIMVQNLLNMVAKYNYKMYCKEQCKENLFVRSIPNGQIKMINHYHDIEEEVIDLSQYERIVHIGDIHGCYNVLKEAWDKHYNDKNFYIFIGDYIDKGKQNVEVIKFLIDIHSKENVCLLKGNHDGNLHFYAINEPRAYFDIRFKEARKQIEKSDIAKDQIRRLYNSFKEVIIYNFKGKKVIATHGGVPNFPENKVYEINSEDIVRGQLNDFENVDKLFMENTKGKELYQVHGHSNLFNIEPNKFERSINLEGGVELGGHLVLCELSKAGMKTFKYKNKNSIMINYFK